MKTLPFLLLWVTVISLNPESLYAGNKKDAQKKIDALNQEVQKAADGHDLQKAITSAEDALDIASKEFGESSIEAAKAMNNVANLYLFSDHPQEAERLYKQSILIESYEKGKDSLEVADSYYNLAMAYAMQKKFDEARKMMDLTFKVRKEKLGASHPDTLKAQEMGNTLWNESKS